MITFRIADRSLRLASVRYRGLTPCVALQQRGWSVSCISGNDATPEATSLGVAVKPLQARDANWIRDLRQKGIPVIVDICDNIFVPGYGGRNAEIADRFHQTLKLASALIVPTPALAEVMQRTVKDTIPMLVMPDIVETDSLLRQQRALVGLSSLGSRWFSANHWRDVLRDRMERAPSGSPSRKLIWFGNHGADYASFGITDILLFADALQALARDFDIELWVVSNSREKYEQVVLPIGVKSRYLEWNERQVDKLLPDMDVCIVPNSLDEFSITKSANRALKALAAGVPVVATRTSAYAELDGAVWLGDPLEGLREYLGNASLRRKHLKLARETIQRRFSLQRLGEDMESLFRRLPNEVSAP